ncbi:hypothetical protein Taro_047426 [Colocasia esculenta]|uniref:CCHC-type domain-containing protein n=1 Tax=Colocasia esculenta TaxID=4460 RepID=A0A843X0Z4_COLES|nr:hypothetical protein [Colocasia esculenta]
MELYLAEKKARLEMLPEPFQRKKRKMRKLMKRQQRTMIPIESTFQSVVLAGNEKPVCVHCGKRHGGDICWTRLGRCLKCGSKNHRIKDCPNQKKRLIHRDVPVVRKPSARGDQGEGFPTAGLASASTKNPEESSFVTCWGILPCSGLLSSDEGWYNRTGWKWVVASLVPLMAQWEVTPDPQVTDRRAEDVRAALDHYPHDQVVWTPYVREADALHPAVAAGRPLFDRHLLLLCLGTCEVLYLELVVRTMGWHQPAMEVPSLGREGHSRRQFFAEDRDWS